MSKLVRKLGSIKKKEFEKNFDSNVINFKNIAVQMGYLGDLKFKIEKGKVIIFVELNE